MANGTLLDELMAQMKKNKQAPSAGGLSPSAPKTSNYGAMFKKALDETYRYAQVSPQTSRDVANTITPGGAMTAYARGDVKSFNWDEAIQAERDRAAATDYFRKSGLYDNDDYLYNDAYRFLVGTDYIKQQQPALKARLVTSSFLDGLHRAAAQTAVSVGNARKVNQQAVRGFYNDMAARGVLENGNYTTDDLLYIDSILNGTPRRSAEEFDSLPDEEWASEYERMEAQAEGVDWGSLLEAEDTHAFTPYESETDAILSKIRTGEKELERREAFDALRADIRNDPNYDTMSAYTDTYVAPGRSIFGDQYAPYVNGYDILGRFINSGAPWAELQVAGEHSMAVQGYLNAGYNMLTPDEIADYNYLINTGREDDAARYLELLRPELLLRRAMVAKSWQSVKATNPVLGFPTFIDAGFQTLASVASLPLQAYEAATGRDDPFSPANDVLNKVKWTTEAHLGWIEDSDMADWLKDVTSVVYKGAAGWRDNVFRLAASGFNPTVSLLIAGAQSASGSLHESSERDDVSGAAKIVKALATGAMEMGTEKIGLDALFSKGHGGALEYLKGVILSELGEESLNYISEPALEAAVAFLFDHEAEIMSGPEFWNGLTDTMLTTAISSLLMGGGGAIQMDAGHRRAGKGLRNDGDVESVLQIAEGLGADTISAQIAKSIRAAEEGGKKVSTRELGKLVSALSSDIGEQNATAVNAVYEDAIADRLIELGEEKSKARKQAKVIRRISAGEVLSVAERMSVNWSDNASQVVRELTTEVREGDEGRVGRDWKVRAVQLAEETSAPYVDKGVLFEKALHTKPGTTTETTAAPAVSSDTVVQQGEEMAAAGKNKFGPNPLTRAVIFDADGAEQTGEVVRFEKDKDGMHAVVATTADGKTANVTVDLESITASASAGIGSVIRYVQNASTRGHDMSAAEASSMIRLYEQEGGDAKTFIDGFEKAYLAGYAGIELDSAGISEAVAKIAYDQGKAEAVADEKGRVARATRVRADSKGVVSWLGKVSSGKEVRGTGDANALSAAMRKMTSSQRTAVQVVQAFADKFKTNVVLFESSEENIGSIENGSYAPNTNTIYIDINSGADSAESIKAGRKHNTLGHAMVRTLGHELTHHLESTSPEAYATYKQAVKTALKEQGQDWATLVRGKLDTARNAGRKLTYAGAEAEVIADASEYMLQNSKFVKEIDNSTKGRVKKFIKDFMKKLGEVFSTLTRAHTESAAIRKEVDGVKQYMGNLQQLWDAAMEETMGGEMSDGVVDTAYKTGEVYSYTTQNSLRVRDEETVAYLENQPHITTYRAMQVIDGKLYPPMAEFIGSKKDGNREGPGILGQWEMAAEHPELIKWVDGKPKFELKKTNDDGSVSTVPAAYNPYMHSSNTVLNDQFSKAFQRKNLVVVECVVPASESNGAYHAQYAKDATGWHEWKSGIVAGDLAKQKGGFRRDVFLSRYIKPVRILSDTEVAEKIAGYLEGTDVTVPFQSAWPTLRDALVEAGVKVTEPRGLGSSQLKIAMEAFEEWKNSVSEQEALPEQKSTRDRQYMEAVERGDMETAQKMVDEAAEEKMPESKLRTKDGKLRKVYHGTNAGEFYEFNPDYIGSSSGDDGFFGMGFYFAYSKGEASYYGAKRIISAYLDLKNPFDFEKEIRTLHGKRARGGYAPDAVALVNFANKFPEIAKKISITVAKGYGSDVEKISAAEFARKFEDVLAKQSFEYQEMQDQWGNPETLVLADPEYHEYEHKGEIRKYKDYKFQKRFAGKPEELDVAYEYLSNAVYSYIDMPSFTRIILDNNRAFTNELKRRGYDGTIQSEDGDEAVAFSPEQIKYAEPVTYDDYGDVVPLSERFNTESPDIRYSTRDLPPEVTAREFLAEADSSIAETVEERNALSIYQGLLLKHADASDKVIAAERVLAVADEEDLPEARKALTAARARQKELYNRLLNVERTAHVQTIVKRTNRIIGELSGKNQAEMDKMVSALERKVESLRLDLQGLKVAAKTQREADARASERDIVAHEIKAAKEQREADLRAAKRELAVYKSKAAQALIANNEKHTKRIADLRERNELNVEIGKKARHIKRVVKRLNDRIIHEEDYKNVKEPLKPAVHNLVRAFIDGFGNLVFDQKTADRLRTVYDKIADEKEGSPDFYSDDVANWLTDLSALAEEDEARRITGGSSLESVEQKLETYNRVAEIADHIYKMVAEADEIFVNGKRESFAAISGEVGGGLVSKKDKPLLVGKAREAVRIFDDLIRTGNMTPQYFFDHLKNSGLSKLFSGLMTGQTQYAQRIREGQETIADAKRRYNFYAWKNMKQGVEFKTEQGHTISLTVPQMMWVYATAKREATNTLMDTHHLDEGGFRYEANDLPKQKGKLTAIPGIDRLHKLSANDVAKITATLTAEQIACAGELVSYLSNECAEQGNAASMELFGIKKYNEEYYFPFKTASDQRYQRSDAGSTSTTNDARVKHASFTHSLRKGANTALVMGDFFDVIADHINLMATYSSFVVPIESMNRVLNTKINEEKDGSGNDVTIRSLVGRKHGDPAQKYIADLMKDLNGGPQTDNRGGISGLFRAFKRGAVMGSLSVALQQPTAIVRAFAYVNPKYFAHITMEGNKKTWERMMKYSGTTVIKDMGKFDVGTGRMANDWIANSDTQDYKLWQRAKFLMDTKGWKAVKDNFIETMTALPGVMDRITWSHIWKAIEAEQADLNPSMDRNSDEFLRTVGARFDDVINHTQVYDSILAKSQNMRSKNPLTQMSTAFMSEPTLNINMLYDAVRGDHSKGQRASIITSVVTSNILATAAAALIAAWNKDDDDRNAVEKYLTTFASRALDNLNPLTMIPYVADLWNLVNGYDIERTDLSVIKDAWNYGSTFMSKAFDPEKENTWRDYENFFGTIANLFGIPAKNVSRDIRRARNFLATDKAPAPGSNLKYALVEELTPFGLYKSSNSAYCQRLVAAVVDGDAQEAYDLWDYMTNGKKMSQGSLETNIRGELKRLVKAGEITPAQATAILRKYVPYKDDKNNVKYPQDWLNEKE